MSQDWLPDIIYTLGHHRNYTHSRTSLIIYMCSWTLLVICVSIDFINMCSLYGFINSTCWITILCLLTNTTFISCKQPPLVGRVVFTTNTNLWYTKTCIYIHYILTCFFLCFKLGPRWLLDIIKFLGHYRNYTWRKWVSFSISSHVDRNCANTVQIISYCSSPTTFFCILRNICGKIYNSSSNAQNSSKLTNA